MNPQETLDKYSTVVVDNSSTKALDLSLRLRKLNLEEQRNHFGGHMYFGFFWLYRHHAIPGKVMESIASPDGDAITSLYNDHPIFATIGSLMAAREAIVNAVAEKIGLSRGLIGIDDAGRGRQVGLADLSTGQLLDVLAERMGSTLIQTNSMGGDSDLLKQLARI